MRHKHSLFLHMVLSGMLCLILAITGCSAKHPVGPVISGDTVLAIPPPPTSKDLVALIGFENKSTFAADKLWETSAEMLISEMIKAGYFRVVEWEKMKQLFDREVLKNCSLIKENDKRADAQKILLCEYFLSGALTRFDVTQRSQVSALSKAKTYETSIRVDLLLQDSRSGEYVSQGRGEAKAVQTIQGGALGGQTGSWDPASANEALERAISAALSQLINNFVETRKS
ncbi:hypothetical protein JXQ70_15010 [bacterium]|nr:hypothetical protein [bacterium]